MALKLLSFVLKMVTHCLIRHMQAKESHLVDKFLLKKELTDTFLNFGRTLNIDNWFTSVDLITK